MGKVTTPRKTTKKKTTKKKTTKKKVVRKRAPPNLVAESKKTEDDPTPAEAETADAVPTGDSKETDMSTNTENTNTATEPEPETDGLKPWQRPAQEQEATKLRRSIALQNKAINRVQQWDDSEVKTKLIVEMNVQKAAALTTLSILDALPADFAAKTKKRGGRQPATEITKGTKMTLRDKYVAKYGGLITAASVLVAGDTMNKHVTVTLPDGKEMFIMRKELQIVSVVDGADAAAAVS